MKQSNILLAVAVMAVTSLSTYAADDAHAGMHQMPNGAWMKNNEMAVPTATEGKTIVATVNGLVCDFCAQAIRKTLLKQAEVKDARVDLTAKTVTVELKEDTTLPEARLKALLKDAGYDMTAYKVN